MYDIFYSWGRWLGVIFATVIVVAAAPALAAAPPSPATPASTAAPASPAASPAADDWTQRTAVGLDLGLGSTITRYSPASDGGSVFFLSLHGSYDIDPDWSLQLSLQQWALPGSNHATVPTFGARFEPYRNQYGRAFGDIGIGLAFTSDATGVAFDLGAGFEFDLPVAPGLSLGPAFRYSEVVAPAPRNDGDGRAWQLGVSATFHLGRYQASAKAERALHPNRPVRPWVFMVPDTDHDGVTDDADQCPAVPAGPHPDAFRPGCPENDEDKDGFPDSVDDCPLTPAGDHPDRTRRGCPFIDSDNDGIPDTEDQCPNKAGPASQKVGMNGCPEPHKAAPAPPTKEPVPDSALSAPKTTSKKALNRGKAQ